MENIELLENEYFVSIKGYEGLYEISNMGRVKTLERKIKNGLKSKNLQDFNTRKESILKVNKDAYGSIALYKDNKYKVLNIRDLMMLNFTDFIPKDGYRIVNIDGNYGNNAFSNLKVTKNIRWREIVPMVRKGVSLQELSDIYGFSVEKLQTIKPRKDQKGISHIYVDDKLDYFETINTEEKAYWLGFIAADGCVTNRSLNLCISKTDVEHLKKFRDCINPKRPIKEYKSKYSPIPLTFVNISNIKITESLIQYGIVERKTFKLHKLPDIPEELIRHFIRGYFDGDGSLSQHFAKHSPGYTGFTFSILGNKPFLQEIQQHLISKCDLTETNIALCKPKKNQITCQYVKGGNPQVLRILTYLYKDSTIFLQRKYEKFLLLKDKVENNTLPKMTDDTLISIKEYYLSLPKVGYGNKMKMYEIIGEKFGFKAGTIKTYITKNKQEWQK